MNTFLFFRYGIRMLYFFSYLVKEFKYSKQSTNTANIVLLSANQIADIFSCKALMGSMCIVIICFPVYDVRKFETNFTFLMKLFSYITIKIRTNLNNKKSF